jgi:hypothetical protein
MVKPLAAGFSLAIGEPSIKPIVQFYRKNATRVSLAHTCFDRERSIRAIFRRQHLPKVFRGRPK